MIMFFGFINTIILIEHFKELRAIQDVHKSTVTVDFLYSFLLNIGAPFSAAMGFGRPYGPCQVYTVGILVLLNALILASGLLEWMDRLILHISIFAFIIEYFQIGFNYWTEQHRENDKIVSIKLFVFFVCMLILLYLKSCLSILSTISQQFMFFVFYLKK